MSRAVDTPIGVNLLQQQVLGVSGRDHLSDHEPRMRRGDHQDRPQRRGAIFQRDLPRREPQVALRRIARLTTSTGLMGRPADAQDAAHGHCRGTP